MKQKTEAQQGSIEQLIYEETERRLEIMQSDTYEFPKKMTRVDYGIIIASVAASLVLIVTCMLGG
ncbi:MAG: hypothetical protein ACLR5E_04445 [Oscillospiraceae bacterium]|nr:hypothetical protein [Oscillospiraceae bacterium]MBS6835261.1 hypothetical protein [Bacillota bacterium]UYI84854.1 MAG: hypothetical protein OGM61_01950 [Clostridiales bacterium]MBP8751645.1 hypothetical protein [Oscillospiraceae bacterium]MBS1408650.1 hypothetical protein [Oscillospiraceae bacterium]